MVATSLSQRIKEMPNKGNEREENWRTQNEHLVNSNSSYEY
jgi:hypothetical protein